MPLARLAFHYGGHVVAYTDASQYLQFTEARKLVLIPRHAMAELRARDLLRRMDLGPLDKSPFGVAGEYARDMFLYPEGKRQNVYELVGTFDEPARFLA